MARYTGISRLLLTVAAVILGITLAVIWLGESRGTPKNLQPLEVETSPDNIATIVRQLWSAKSAQFTNAPDDLLREAEASLSAAGVALTTPDLIRTLENDEADIVIRFWSAVALGKRGDPSALPALIDTLRNPRPELRAAAALALGELRDPSAVPHLKQMLQDPSINVRSMAVQALGQIGGDKAVTYLGEKLVDTNEPSANIRANAAFRLGKLGATAAEPWLIAALKDQSLEVRTASAVALAEFGSKEAIPTLIEVLQAPSARESLVVDAIFALRKLTDLDFGYPKKYFAPATKEERDNAIKGWIEWWENQQ